MDIREKLIELMIEAKKADTEDAPFSEFLADFMIANGVTVQEWVSVEDRLPEENTTVIAATDKGIVFQCLYDYDGWDLWDGNEINITHWQPMPEPPEGE